MDATNVRGVSLVSTWGSTGPLAAEDDRIAIFRRVIGEDLVRKIEGAGARHPVEE